MLGNLNDVTQWWREQMDQLLGPALNAGVFPAVNLWADADRVYAEAEVPGLKIEDLSVSVHGNQLILEGDRKIESPEREAFSRQERFVGPFSRRIELPFEIQADKVEASLQNGVLTITLPKADAAKPRKVDVKYGETK